MAKTAPTPKPAAKHSDRTAGRVEAVDETAEVAKAGAVDTGTADADGADATVAGTADAGATDTDTTDVLRQRLSAVETELAEAQDGLLRARAEVENIRRRAHKNEETARKYAIDAFAKELLGVCDSLEQAAMVELEQADGEAMKRMKEGLGLTMKQLHLAMAKFAVAEVEAAPGARFDPQRHQAVSTAPAPGIEPDHIVTVVQKGFMLKERLLRPAMVVVAPDTSPATPPPEASPSVKPKAA